MSSVISPTPLQSQKTHACADSGGDCVAEMAPVFESGLLARQAGQLLTTLGYMFVRLPAFNAHISRHTGELLIAVGKNLTEAAR